MTRRDVEFERIPAVRLFKGDTERIKRFFPNVPYNRVIREIIHRHLDKIEAQAAKQAPPLPEFPVEIKKGF